MKIFIDYDTTLVNLIDPWIEWVNKKYNVTITSSDINRWCFLGEVFGNGAYDFWRSEEYNQYTDKQTIKPFAGAVDFFHAVEEKFGKNNVFIASSTRQHCKIDKIKHAQHYFGIDKKQFIAMEKEKYGDTKNGILIDDYPLHVMEHIEHNKQKGIVFNYQNRFGWCDKNNYHLDETLDKLINVVENENFSIVMSYDEILKELDNA